MFSAAYVTQGGQLREARGRPPAALHGRRLVPLDPAELIPLPPGSVLSMLPERVALAADGELPGLPAAALLPIGYTRTLLPAYARPGSRRDVSAGGAKTITALPARGDRHPPAASSDLAHLAGAEESLPLARSLPLFGYTAVAVRGDQLYVAAMPTDDPRPWQHPDPGYRRLRRLVNRRLRQPAAPGPGSAALLRHLAHCALEYECRSAQHLFYAQGEAALPSSPVCNAACVGCISEQPDPDLQPHDRLAFLPSIEESVDLAIEHLERAPGAIISFGQGCEGEPLLNGRNVEVVRRVRSRTSRGTINLNTNGSRPEMLRRLIDAGLNSIRVSVFSAREDTFRRYYRPERYSLDSVRACLDLAANHRLLTSVNLLTFPGITDDEAEVEAMIDLLMTTGTRLAQLRNLNIDPEQLFEAFEGVDFRPMGIRAMSGLFREAGLAVGSYTHVALPDEAGSFRPEASLAEPVHV